MNVEHASAHRRGRRSPRTDERRRRPRSRPAESRSPPRRRRDRSRSHSVDPRDFRDYKRRRCDRTPSYYRRPGERYERDYSRRDFPDGRRRPWRRSLSPDQQSPRAIPRTGVVSIDDEAGTKKAKEIGATRSASCNHDDSVGHFRGGPGAVIADRYRVVAEVGTGTFGRVLECMDLMARKQRRPDYVAIKVVRDVQRYYDSAVIEARIMRDINRHGGRGLSHCVVLHDAFTFRGHYCLVMENLGPSLYDFLKRHDFKPFPMVCIQDFAVQVLETLEFLHSFRLIHTDLKIENILLTNDRVVIHENRRLPQSTRIKVIDFGGSCYDTDKKSTIINTRQYRAPEVILQAGWSMPSDMWSAGCILAELYTGELLFPTHDSIEHLALIERTVGLFPRDLLRKARKTSPLAKEAFDSFGCHRLESVLTKDSYDFVRRSQDLPSIIIDPADSWFLNLLQRMLVIDPCQRETAHECLVYLSRIRRDVARHL